MCSFISNTLHYVEVSKGKVCSKYEKILSVLNEEMYFINFFIISRHYFLIKTFFDTSPQLKDISILKCKIIEKKR